MVYLADGTREAHTLFIHIIEKCLIGYAQLIVRAPVNDTGKMAALEYPARYSLNINFFSDFDSGFDIRIGVLIFAVIIKSERLAADIPSPPFS